MKCKKPDEMDMAISFKAMRLSWVFVNVSLLLWLVLDYFNIILLAIVCVQNILYFGSKVILTRKMSC
jgi:hypothetical protein